MVRASAWCVHVHGACACCSMPASEAASFASLGFMRLAEAKFSVAWLGFGLGLGLGLGFVLSRLASAYERAMPRCPGHHHAPTMRVLPPKLPQKVRGRVACCSRPCMARAVPTPSLTSSKYSELSADAA